ncbi:hypothetical protein SASPL_112043 [Salvia splendens]|uniref:GTD-binding domain-containing protein n=1 Tax=Salvia splendens TaxID=180675 RepID=A0A8X9A4W8_SALSN|nr:myosin-binding protein 7-like [Salvia splendens]XP_042057013.1 myosin-binding protein 7-like [Salvia splendens]XP_042057014.1 myosin-binding protein 7-like [Salvia splendens]XP_042057015.1 myosin-binding protein 7-like [Salvia splendens]KAG6427796.1 hypothetical protein SASPL_112043 [Salvia splendens]
MANYSTVMSESEIASLKNALCAQQKLLQKLYIELDAEREASATAASEALSVILRLQGEKAAVKMEAEQYKRLAEERMCHAEESFALIEDMITEKEMEVAELDYQVQTYRYQLMSMGFDVPSGDDMNIPENLLHRNECVSGETCLHLKCKKALLDLEGSTNVDVDVISKPIEEEQSGQETNESFVSGSERKLDGSTHEGMFSYAEQIKELDLLVKDMTGANITGSVSEALNPAISKKPSLSNLSSYSGDSSQDTKAVHSPCPPTVHDVFEVPQVDQLPVSYEASEILEIRDQAQPSSKVCQASQDPTHPESVKKIAKNEPDWLKKLLDSTDHDKNLCKPSDIAAIDRGIVQSTASADVASVQPRIRINVSESNLDQLERHPEMQPQSSEREEELILLKEIWKKLSLLQDQIAIQKVKAKKSFPANDEPSLQPLAEMMVSFWL